jgi:hypothetical protein
MEITFSDNSKLVAFESSGNRICRWGIHENETVLVLQ